MSATLFEQAKQVIPGGVNSPVRAFSGVHGDPVFIKHAQGTYLYDENEKAYIDYVGSWGPMITGHADPDIIAAVQAQLPKGLSYGAPTQLETQLAALITDIVPNMDLVRMVNSGTEATMSAIRLARGYTGRDKIIKFEGCYHGHVDSLLIKAGSGALTLGEPTSPGIPNSLAEHTLVLEYNNSEQLTQAFEQWGQEIAAVIIEPVAGNMNCIAPLEQFLKTLRALCDTHQSVLIFDEVMTGFRVALGGAQSVYGIDADLITLGKVIGGGLPVGAFGGKRAIMEHISPLGPVYQAGTLSGNPLAMSAGLTLLNKLQSNKDCYAQLSDYAQQLCHSLESLAEKHGIAFTTRSIGSMLGLFFTTGNTPNTFQEVMQCNIEQFKRFHQLMLEHGVYLAPSAFEAGFINTCMNDEHLKATLDAANAAFETIASEA